MLRLAGASADGASLNWATPEQIAAARVEIDRARRPRAAIHSELSLSMYIRVCIDHDVAAARRCLRGAGARLRARPPRRRSHARLPGTVRSDGIRHPALRRSKHGASTADLLDDVPEALLDAVGYYGTPEGAAERFAQLAVGLDEVIVRVITTEPNVEKVRLCLDTLTPAAIRGAAK